MYKVLQYSPNSRFSVFSVHNNSRENIHFTPSQRHKALLPLQQFHGQQEESPALLLSPGVAGHSSWPFLAWGTWLALGKVLGILAHPGTSWDILGPCWRSWSLHPPGKYCTQRRWTELLFGSPFQSFCHSSVKCHGWAKCHFWLFSQIDSYSLIGHQMSQAAQAYGVLATRSCQIKSHNQ